MTYAIISPNSACLSSKCDETEDTVCVKAKVNEAAMIQFAQSYAPDVEILKPVELREKVKERLRKGYRCYE